jgi:hypothetical protein
MSMDIIPAMNCATERKTEVRFTAKPVWLKRVLNCVWMSVAIPRFLLPRIQYVEGLWGMKI